MIVGLNGCGETNNKSSLPRIASYVYVFLKSARRTFATNHKVSMPLRNVLPLNAFSTEPIYSLKKRSYWNVLLKLACQAKAISSFEKKLDRLKSICRYGQSKWIAGLSFWRRWLNLETLCRWCDAASSTSSRKAATSPPTAAASSSGWPTTPARWRPTATPCASCEPSCTWRGACCTTTTTVTFSSRTRAASARASSASTRPCTRAASTAAASAFRWGRPCWLRWRSESVTKWGRLWLQL